MARLLPSMGSLRAFEAAARLQSFTKAAAELNITQGAVSQRIKALERQLRITLFTRDGNAILLTQLGREYLVAIRGALDSLVVAGDRASYRQRMDVLTIACLPTFAIKCLIPALPDFRRRHPRLSLRVRSVPYANLLQQDYDVSIQFGMGDWPETAATRIADEELFPVCSPALLKGRNALRSPRDLRKHTLIRTTAPIQLVDDWPMWLRHAGVPGLEPSDELTCDYVFPCIEAAADGLGIAIGRSTVVAADLASGRLVDPFGVRAASQLSYYVTTPSNRVQIEKIALFRDWIVDRYAGMRAAG